MWRWDGRGRVDREERKDVGEGGIGWVGEGERGVGGWCLVVSAVDAFDSFAGTGQ